MDVEVPPFEVQFLESIKDLEKEDIPRYAAFLNAWGLKEKNISRLTREEIERFESKYKSRPENKDFVLVEADAAAIAEAAQRYGKKLRRGASVLEQQGKRAKTIVAENTGEGLSLFDPLKSFRTKTCEVILDSLLAKRVILVRSPPYSGKTSLASLVANFVYERGFQPLQVTFLGYEPEDDFEQYCKTETEQSWQQWFAPEEPSIVILDEVQTLYSFGSGHKFWSTIKKIMQQRPVNLEGILLIATYGEKPDSSQHAPTPVAFDDDNTRDLSLLRFSKEEYQELLENYHQLKRGKIVPISQEVSEVIYEATRGHPGLTRRFLKNISNHFMEQAKSSKEKIQDDDIISYLMSDSFSTIISDSRAVPAGALSGPERLLVERVINLESIQYPTNQIEIDAAQLLIKAGILARVKTNLEFSAPIIRTIFLQKIHGAPREKITSSDFATFLVGCIQRLRPDTLKSSLSIGADKALLERQWQMEFYRVATTLLPEKAHISPDVGRVFKSEGFLDFYVNCKLQWAIELLREGYKSTEHSDRFEKGGLYYVMRKKIKHIAIIDFCAKDIPKSNMQEHFWYVIYNSAYTHVTIKRLGHEDLVNVPLYG